MNNLIIIKKIKASLSASLLKALESSQLSGLEWNALDALTNGAGFLSDLADVCGIKPSAMTRLTPRLEQRKLIKVSADKFDSRLRVASITAKGAKLHAKLKPDVDEALSVCTTELFALRKLLRG